jgi:Winged helix DNA-binding domain
VSVVATSMRAMDGLEIAHRRLHNQRLSGPPAADPVDVVRHLGAVQAQEYAVAKWSVGQRTAGAQDRDVQALIDSGAIVRTHALRPTWHFVAAEDVGWIQALTGPRVLTTMGHYYRQAGLDDAELIARSTTAIVAALRGGNHLTRTELGTALAAGGVEATGTPLGFIVMRAEVDGLIGNGVMRGKQHTYALLEERVENPQTYTHEEALAELTRRYFTSHGPATIKDFVWWSSLTVAQIRKGLSLVGSALVSETVDGRQYWFAPGDPPPRDRSLSVHVLQTYDEYGVAYTESRPVLNLARLDLQLPNNNTLAHLYTVDSQAAGWWRRIVERDGIVADMSPVLKLTVAKRKAVEAAFRRYAAFANVPVTVKWPVATPTG